MRFMSPGASSASSLTSTRAMLGGEASDMDLRDLLLHRGNVLRMRIAEARDADARQEIDVPVAVDIEEQRALAMIDADRAKERKALRAGCEMLLLFVEDLTRFGPAPTMASQHTYIFVPANQMKRKRTTTPGGTCVVPRARGGWPARPGDEKLSEGNE